MTSFGVCVCGSVGRGWVGGWVCVCSIVKGRCLPTRVLVDTERQRASEGGRAFAEVIRNSLPLCPCVSSPHSEGASLQESLSCHTADVCVYVSVGVMRTCMMD